MQPAQPPTPLWAIGRKTTVGFVVALGLVLVAGLLAQVMLAQVGDAGRMVFETHEVLDAVGAMTDRLREAELEQQAVLLYGPAGHREAYRSAAGAVLPAAERVGELTVGKADQQRRLADLRPLLERRLRVLEEGLRVYDSQGTEAATRWLRRNDDPQALAELRQRAGVLAEAELARLENRSGEFRSTARTTSLTMVFANLVALVLVAGGLLLLNREVIRRARAEAELRRSHDELDRRVQERTAALSRANEALLAEASQRRRTEERQAQLAAIVDASDDAIIGTTVEGVITSWNGGAERLFGWPAAEAVGRPIGMVVPPDRTDETPVILARVRRGEHVDPYETVRLRKDGGTVEVSLRFSPIPDAAGQVVGVSAIARDLSERRRLERQLHQAQKMEAIGQLAGGLAHDFNNLLTVIGGYAELLTAQADLPPAAREALAEVGRAAERAGTLTRQLLAFSRQQVLNPVVLDLNALLTGVHKMLRRLIGEDVELVVTPGEGLHPVKVDPGQVEQVLLNLAVNARDAMPEGGRLTVETRNVELGEEQVRGRPDLRPGPYVLLAVSDTGHGMDEATRARAFEPFFTTKAPGKGTGLGLATVYGIVRQSGGHVTVYSEPGHGTTFKIYLPRAAEAAAPAGGAAAPPAARGGDETILLVEDDEPVRALGRRTLQAKGYRVLEAADGTEALEVAERHGGPIALLVADLVLPRLGGRPLAAQLTARRPRLRALYMSGYAADAAVRNGMAPSGAAFLQKPFTPEDLARKVREVLDQ